MFLDENVFPLFMHVCILFIYLFIYFLSFWMELIELFSFLAEYIVYILGKVFPVHEQLVEYDVKKNY